MNFLKRLFHKALPKSIILTLMVLLLTIQLPSAYIINPFTGLQDYYQAVSDSDLDDLADVTLTSIAGGAILYRNAGNTAWVNLAKGSNGKFLTLTAGVPAWATIPAGITTFIGDTDTPADYSGSTSYMVRVNGAGDALVFGAEGDIDHDGLTNWAANKHVVLPGVIASVLSDHTLLVHTTLGLFDASSDVDHDLTTNYDSNRHTDHTAVSILSAGLITGGGTIDGNQTLTLTEATIESAIDTLGAIQFTGDVEFLEDITVTWADAADHMIITQSSATGIEDQALIYIDDDRTGTTADEVGEATIVIDSDGTYAMYFLDGTLAIASTSQLRMVNSTIVFAGGSAYLDISQDGGAIDYGASHLRQWWLGNGAGDDLHAWVFNVSAVNDTAAIFMSSLKPNGMTDHDDYASATFVLANDEGADANDYAGVVIGERAQSDVTIAHYFDFYAMTGAADGTPDANATELAAIFRFGASGTTVPAYATTPGDVLFEGAIEVANVLGYDYTTDHNLLYGYLAGEDLAGGGQYNTLIGEGAGAQITTGDQNTIVGYNAGGNSMTVGNYQTLMGYQAGFNLPNDTTASYNTFIGTEAGYTTTTSGAMNVFIGYRAGRLNQGGYDNVFVGMIAGETNVIGYANVYVGNDAGQLNTQNYNTFVGGYAGWKATTGGQVLIGGAAGYSLTTGTGNTVVGRSGLWTDDDGGFNTAIGGNALFAQDSAWFNTAVGYLAGQMNVTGQNNVSIGHAAGMGVTTNSNSSNVFIGSEAAEFVTTASQNVIIGHQAAEDLTSGGGHVVIGYMAGEGWLDTETNLLVIDNSDTATPLIYGDFNADNITINGDFNITMDAALDQIVIAQSAVVGTEDQPLIFINDDRTGATVDEVTEATIVMDTEGIYALYILDGLLEIGGASGIRSASYITMYDDKDLNFGTSFDINQRVDINGTGDRLWTWQFRASINSQTNAIFLADLTNPSNMTTFDDYLAPTFVIAHKAGADTGDFAAVVIGERTTPDVTVAHYFDFWAMTGAADGSVDPNAVELAAIFRFGASGSVIPEHATEPGDVLFEGSIEIDGNLNIDGEVFHGSYVVSKVVNFDDGSPVVICSVADGYLIVDVIVEITTAWDGNGTIVVGDGNTADGFMEDADITQGGIGYNGRHHDERGVYLWDSAGAGTGHEDSHIYEGADTIDATLVVGTSTQGIATVYVHITRLK